MALIVTLVHGTWASESDWVREDSPLCKAFAEVLDDAIKPQVFRWSGQNSFSARQAAAAELQAFLNERIRLFPSDRHAIVAHSHGGNVTLLALRDEVLRSRIDSVVCLSTPFIAASLRNLGEFSDVDVSFLLWLIATVACVTVIAVTPSLKELMLKVYFPENASKTVEYAVLLVLVILVSFIRFTLKYLLTRWRNFAEAFERKLAFPQINEVNLLVVRPPADEASAALVAMQFVGLVASKAWMFLSGLPRVLSRISDTWWAWSSQNRRLAILISVAISTGTLGSLQVISQGLSGTIADLREEWPYALVLIPIVAFMTWAGYIVIFSQLLSIVGLTVVSLLLFPLLLVLSITLLPFSPLAALLIGLLEITVEATPPGKCFVVQLPPTSALGLRHSSTYLNPIAIKATVDWIVQNYVSGKEVNDPRNVE